MSRRKVVPVTHKVSRSALESTDKRFRNLIRRLRAVPTDMQARHLSDTIGPLAVFLPATARTGAAHLRIFNLAEGLKTVGWRSLVLPSTLSLAERHRLLRRYSPDLLVMQGARHRLNRPGLYPDWPVVFDMDDADFHLPHLSEAVRRSMPHVAHVIAGSEYVANWCRQAGAGRADVVWTGTPVSKRPRPRHADRGPVVAWAQTRPMTYRVEAELVRQVVPKMAARFGAGLTLRLYDRQRGDDPGFARSFQTPGVRVEWVRKMSYADYLASFDDVSLGLAPLCPETPFSRGKSFGKVLAYLDRMVPVLASDACEHGRFFTAETGVVSNDPEHWAEAGARFLSDPDLRQTCAEAAFWAFQSQLGLDAATAQVDGILRQTLFQTRGANQAVSG